ncbi:MAG: response regulator transcription factor, partial [Chloroflexi bacterium]|nr:response regulator transcription factor [Chloroflexota bacterium]
MSVTKAIRVFIADDHIVVREGLRALISTEPDIEIIGEAADGKKAVAGIHALQPDVILLDLIMPQKNGIEVIMEVTQENPRARILVLTSFADDEKVFSAIKAGALGYLLKDSSPQELIQAIHDVYHGESSLDPTIALKLLREFKKPAEQLPAQEPLTEREINVLSLVSRGLTNQEIANTLQISERTVRTHVGNILSKLHLANRTQAALYALRKGLTSLD